MLDDAIARVDGSRSMETADTFTDSTIFPLSSGSATFSARNAAEEAASAARVLAEAESASKGGFVERGEVAVDDVPLVVDGVVDGSLGSILSTANIKAPEDTEKGPQNLQHHVGTRVGVLEAERHHRHDDVPGAEAAAKLSRVLTLRDGADADNISADAPGDTRCANHGEPSCRQSTARRSTPCACISSRPRGTIQLAGP